MKIGDLVEVIDETLRHYHAHGRIDGLTRDGNLIVKFKPGADGMAHRYEFEPHQVELVEPLPGWGEAA